MSDKREKPELKYHAYIAHAGADSSIARELYYALFTEYHVFLASESLIPGDLWDIKLPQAQRLSLLTIILISDSTNEAFYQDEEIASAIHMSRDESDAHRVIPVYLSGREISNDVPYGLRRIHSIYLGLGDKIHSIVPAIDSLIESLKPGEYGLKKKPSRSGKFEEDLYDSVRGIVNVDLHRGYVKDFEKVIEHIAQDHFVSEQPVCMIYFDLDGLSNINRLYGRSTGDAI